jgi:cytosine/adenosine deaminase-related metal-dependent hydrolase
MDAIAGPNKIGSFEGGKEADFIVLDLRSIPVLAIGR